MGGNGPLPICSVDLTAGVLRPDPGTEGDFIVINNPFDFSPGQLNKLLNPKSLAAYQALGGIHGIAKGLRTDLNSGLSIDETNVQPIVSDTTISNFPDTSAEGIEYFQDRTRVFGKNTLPEKLGTPLWKTITRNVYVIVVALIMTLDLVLGVSGYSVEPCMLDLAGEVIIWAFTIFVVVVEPINNWQGERARVELRAKHYRDIKAIRSGKTILIGVYDIVVGDVLFLEPGDVVPVDGIFISGYGVRCDESHVTGESDPLKKTGGDQISHALETRCNTQDLDPFVFSGSKVIGGVGTFVCTSVGVRSTYGKLMMSLREDDTQSTSVDVIFNCLATFVIKYSSVLAISLLLFPIPSPALSLRETFSIVEKMIVFAETIARRSPLGVFLVLPFYTVRLVDDILCLLRRAYVGMDQVVTIWTNKIALAKDKTTVVVGSFGSSGFGKTGSKKPGIQAISRWASNLSPASKNIIIQSVALNSTAFEVVDSGRHAFTGSKMETALLHLAKDYLDMPCIAEVREKEEAIQMMPFDSSKAYMGTVIKLRTGGYRLLIKGASELLLGYCALKTDTTSEVETETLVTSELTVSDRETLKETMASYAHDSLRTIGFAYQDYPQWPPAGVPVKDDRVDLSRLLRDLVFLGVVGIQDPIRTGVLRALRNTRNSEPVENDSIISNIIAVECGILPKSHVLARCLWNNREIYEKRLKAVEETVAYFEHSLGDAFGLKTASFGFAIGVKGAEITKETQAIMIANNKWGFILLAPKWYIAFTNTIRASLTVIRCRIRSFGLLRLIAFIGLLAQFTLLLDTNVRDCITLIPSDINPRTFVIRAHWPDRLDVVALGNSTLLSLVLVAIPGLREGFTWFLSTLLQLVLQRGHAKSKARFSSQGRMFELHGRLNGNTIVANADTGASNNLMSERLAKSMNLNPKPGTSGEILLPSGRRVFSRGQISIKFQFNGEVGTHKLSCVLLPITSYDLVLGGSFLKTSETFTKHKQRLTRIFSTPKKIFLNLVGGQQDFVSGYLNGRECLAVPDTGSDIMALSRGYAKKLGLKIYKSQFHRSKVQFVDGSKAMTDGIVKNVSWQFRPGEPPVECDFHVIRRLPVRAILSNALIDEFNVFSRYSDLIGPSRSRDEHSGVFGIALVERCREEIRSLSESFVEEITSNKPFTSENVERERARRDEIRDWISQLPMPIQAEEQAKENSRQARWNDLWSQYRENDRSPSRQTMGGMSNIRGSSAPTSSHHSTSIVVDQAATEPQNINIRTFRPISSWRRWLRVRI